MNGPVPGSHGVFRTPFHDRRAFTLMELLVALAVFSVIILIVIIPISQMSSGVRSTSAKVEAFQGVRTAIETVTRQLTSATLNTFWDYYTMNAAVSSNYFPLSTNTTLPVSYGRNSNLHFLATNVFGMQTITNALGAGLTPVTHGAFFQVMSGYSTNSSLINPPSTLNPCGFFVAYGNNPAETTLDAATGLAPKPRFRLYQWIASSETLLVNSNSGVIQAGSNYSWIAPSATNGLRPLAENVIAFVIRVPDTNNPDTATNYFWDSMINWPTNTSQPSQMNELPPFVIITMVAVEEAAVNRLLVGSATNSASLAAKALAGTNGDVTQLFTAASNYSTDLSSLVAGLTANHVPYRVFNTTVALPGSKWSP